MKRIGYSSLAALALALGLTVVAQAQTPNANGIKYYLYNWNNCLLSTNVSGGAYPGSWYIDNGILACSGGPLNSGWALSADGGATSATFNDNSNYTFQADFTITGPTTPTWGGAEGGLNVNPWWATGYYGPGGVGTDGKFMVRFGNGFSSNQIACFGGRLPYYDFTAGQGLTYALGTTVTQKITYRSNGLSSSSPATIQYDIKVGGIWYTSGALAFGPANPGDPPPFNVGYGELTNTFVGGYFQPSMDPGNVAADARGTWENSIYSNDQIVPTHNTTWGSLKALYR